METGEQVHNQVVPDLYMNWHVNGCWAEPIPLTEDWLKRFGFEKDEEYDEGGLVDYRMMLMWHSLEFVSFWNSEDLKGVNQPQTGVDVEYVHQLQNLYFALTGEELTKTNKMKAEEKAMELYPIEDFPFREDAEFQEEKQQAFIEGANWQAQREWVNADKLAERIVLNLDAHARGVNRVEYGLPIDPDTKSFDNPLAMDLKTIVLEALSQLTKNK
jgi:hypothetical protein